MKLHFIKIGTVLHICDDTTLKSVLKKASIALNKGYAVTNLKSGTVQYHSDELIINTDKKSSDMYSWDDTGNKVLHNRYRITKFKNGIVEKEFIKKIFKNFKEV